MRAVLTSLTVVGLLVASPLRAQDMAEVAWNMVRNSADPSVLNNFLQQFPDSEHADEAQQKLSALYDEGEALDAPTTVLPAQPNLTPAPSAGASREVYFVLLGAFTDQAGARREVKKLKRHSITVEVLDTNDYGGMTPDLFVLSAGTYSDRDTALSIAEQMRSVVPDAYVKRATPLR